VGGAVGLFGDQLRIWLDAAYSEAKARPGFRLGPVCEEAGIDPSTFHAWRRGEGENATIVSVEALARALGVTAPRKALVFGDDDLDDPVRLMARAQALMNYAMERMEASLTPAQRATRKAIREAKLKPLTEVSRPAGADAAAARIDDIRRVVANPSIESTPSASPRKHAKKARRGRP
jgi:transcriptional regulator with XRE-family HTH domain